MRTRGGSPLRPLALLAVALGVGGALAPAPPPAHADGGVVRARSEQVGLAITVLTSPTPLRVGDADVSVLVQDPDSETPLLDAAIVARVEPRDAAAGDVAASVRLSHQAATNKLLQAGTIALPAAGHFRLIVDVVRDSAHATATAEIEVAPPAPPLLALWPYLALPPVVVGIFLVHQWLRRRSLGTARGTLVAVARGAAR